MAGPCGSARHGWRLKECSRAVAPSTRCRPPVIALPAITIGSDFDGGAADGTAYAKQFSGKYSHRVLRGIRLQCTKEASQAFAEAIVAVDSY
jgi:hypothetical protein